MNRSAASGRRWCGAHPPRVACGIEPANRLLKNGFEARRNAHESPHLAPRPCGISRANPMIRGAFQLAQISFSATC